MAKKMESKKQESMTPLKERIMKEFEKKARKYIKEHGLVKTNASPIFTFGLGFYEGIGFAKKFLSHSLDSYREETIKENL